MPGRYSREPVERGDVEAERIVGIRQLRHGQCRDTWESLTAR